MTKANVLVVEDEPAVAQDIAFILEDHNFNVVGIAHSSEKALDKLYENTTDVILLDINIKGSRNGIELAAIINEKYQIPFIYLTSFNDEATVLEAATTLPYGYLVKPFKDADLAPAIITAISKHKAMYTKESFNLDVINKIANQPLSKTEQQIMKLLIKGYTNQQMADECFVSINTIKTHIANIFLKFDVHSKMQLMQKLR
jgi:DNA-binding NarL/FixJ family response regulator